MWLHALHGVNEQSHALHVYGPIHGLDAALNSTPRPKLVVHLPPRMRRIFPKRARSVLAHHEAGCHLGELQIHLCVLVRRRLDVVGLAILADIHRTSIGLEVLVVFGEAEVVQVVRSPEMGYAGFVGEDLAAELSSCPYTP